MFTLASVVCAESRFRAERLFHLEEVLLLIVVRCHAVAVRQRKKRLNVVADKAVAHDHRQRATLQDAVHR